ncbi:hypothetical protein HMPREF3088_02210 [Corynebacterium sp. HMSC22B11]|uniref:CAP domain-containing protein n=1 Tax=Corynebacterium sp. HMSC22B11 TaxID=1581056 RepID=UPI0008A3FEC8|nr:hypothetical protein [Corynebacterium sp. HMSC22B11]OFO16205.1 hypothetical protein HMPREF3088_02210 [Corynebacterium sp. HMSC22B11]
MKRKLAVATATVLSLAFPTAIANAAPSPTTGVELVNGKDQFGNTRAKFNINEGNTVGLPALKELRSWAWDQNPLFRGYDHEGFGKGTRLQDVARANGITTKDEYLNIATHSDLHWIAVQRAMETSTKFDHVRPDGSSPRTATRNGVTPAIESLSAGTTLRDAIINGWGKSEVKKLNNNGGVWAGGTGHAIHILHPRHKVWGFGQVTVPGSKYRVYSTAVHADMALEDADGFGKNYTNTGNNNPNNPPAMDSSSGSDIGKIIGIILGVVSILGSIWMAIQQFLPR